MTATTDLSEAFKRLTAGLSWLDSQPDGPPRADGIRVRLAAHITGLCDELAGKTGRCLQHVGHPAHNCPLCRSERIGRASWELLPVHPAEVPADAALAEARKLGERDTAHIPASERKPA